MPNSSLQHCKKRIQRPVKQFFIGAALRRQGVYARFNKLRKDGSWKKAWLNVLRLDKHRLDCSSVQLDGRHTRATKGGAAGGYQGREKARTSIGNWLAFHWLAFRVLLLRKINPKPTF